jgi:hypothetical protein
MSDLFTAWRTSSYTGGSGNCVEVAVGWRKSSHSDVNGNCVEVGPGDWRKASYSDGNGGCVEVSAAALVIGVRDTKQHGKGLVLAFPGTTWQAFLTEIKSGQFDC